MQSTYRSIQFFSLAAIFAMTLLTAYACSSTQPYQEAESVEQKAMAVYGTFVIYQNKAANLMTNPNVPDSVKERIQQINSKAHPIASTVVDGTLEINRIKNEIDAGESKQDKLFAALRNVEEGYRKLSPMVQNLITVVIEGEDE